MKIITLLKWNFVFAVFTLLFSTLGFSQSQSFNNPGNDTFTVPAGVTSITVEAWGGGGRGGRRTSDGEGGGGGGGAYALKVLTVVPGTTYSLTVGSGSNSTAAGGDSYFINASTVMAKGGNSVGNNNSNGAIGGSAAASVGDIKYSGGNGSDAGFDWIIWSTIYYGGGGGSSAGTASNGASANDEQGATAPAGGGNGGNGRYGGNNNGYDGAFPGGGGGGAVRTSGTRDGGKGGNGRIIITWNPSNPEINITGNSNNIADGDTTPVATDNTDFGSADILTGSIPVTYTIQNTGTTTLTIGAITFGGTNPGDFTVTTAPAATVAPGGTTTFVVTFNPSAAGIRNATISIVNNDSNENPYNFSIRGNGTSFVEMDVQGNSISIVDGDTTPVLTDWTDFGSADVAIGLINRTFTIYNTGSGSLTVGAITISGANAADFSVTTAPAATVAAGSSTTFVVQFNPGAIGVRNAALSIVNNDPNENPYNFNIRGNGTTLPEVAVFGNGLEIVDGDNTPSTADWTDFGTVNVATGTVAMTFTIQNTGSASLTLGAVTIAGTNAANFTVTTAPAASVAAGGNTTFTITFDPDAPGIRTATISFSNNDSNENPYNFSIQGNGASPEINITGNSVTIVDGDTTPTTADWTDFGSTDVNTGTITQTFTIQNTGDLALTIGAITFSGANANNFVLTTAPATSVAPGGSTTFTVTFNPDAIGIRNAMISIVNNDSNENPYNFNIRGNGVNGAPEISVSGLGNGIADGDLWPTATDGTDFGNAEVTLDQIARTFTIHNTGNAALLIGTVTFTGANAGDFALTTAPAASVPVGGTTTIVVTFDPSAAGIRNANIVIANNDGNESAYTFSLRGTGFIGVPEINVTGNSTTITDGDTTPSTADWTDFGTTNTTSGTIVRTFTIHNTGTGLLTIGAITFTGVTDFTVTTLPASTVLPGQSTTFVVTFNPSSSTVRNAVMYIVNNDSNENPYNFNIRGTGSTNSPEINVYGNLIAIADGDTTPSVSDHTDFGSVSIDGGSTLVTYTIQNTSSGNLNIGAINFTGVHASNYTIVSMPALTLTQNSTTTLIIKFEPTTPGIKNATLSIANDDSNENPFNFSITGLGVRTYADTDGDGISDNIDIDDDNDGIIDIYEQISCITSGTSNSVEYTFLNETFGAGTTKGLININIPGATCTYCFEDGVAGPNSTDCDMQSDWSLNDGEYTVTHMISGPSGDPGNLATWSSTNWTPQEDHTVGDTNGRMAVFNASYTPQIFYETKISGIIPNVPITYTFWAMNIMSQAAFNGTILPNITVDFRDLSNNLLSTFNTGNLGRCNGATNTNTCALSVWKEFTTSVNLGNVTEFIIQFRNNATGGSGNDLALDDITIKQAYCDSDSDGVANVFDLDADNDGIPDIEEAGFQNLSSGQGIMDLASTWVDVNHNGLHDTLDAMIAGGTYVIRDTDLDGVQDFLDLDSDNDTLFDVDEAGLLNGDGDITGDGVGDGPDTDRDGFLNLYDTFNGYGTQVRPFAQDTDGNLIADYRQVDSNSDGVMDIAETLYSSLDSNNDGIIDGAGDSDKDGITDTFDTNTSQLGSPRDLTRKLYLDLDGRNDYAEGSQLLSGLPQATIMGWIKIPANYSDYGIAFGQEMFNLDVDAARRLRIRANANHITYSQALDTDRWYHIAAVFDGPSSTQRLKLFLNGEMVLSMTPVTSVLNSSTSKFTIGKNPTSNFNYFKGSIDEVRVFNAALSADQIQKMVYQEIKSNGTFIQGEIIPKNIESSSWASLLAYYRMDAYKDNVIDNYTTAAIDAGASTTLARIYNVKNIRYQLAPMPFVTTQTGPLDLAVSQNNFVNGADVLTYDWSILHMRHNMNLGMNMTNLGLLIDSSVRATFDNDNVLRNSWYLKLNGVIDLQGKSQLVQMTNSDLDPTSSGYLERDQQGGVNKFNYNYWSSPVGAMNSSTNNNNYTVAGVMKDGTDPNNIANITWVNGYNSLPTSPISLSNYWIYKFQNVSGVYANWTSVGPNGSLLPAQGFTLKGSSALSESQNYTFIGKPFNGIITSPLAPNNLNLSGNPYASALDSQKFISDNTASTTGTLYFWEHFSTNNTHITANYQGGYAALNIVGGTPPVSPATISGLGSSTRIPGRYIPVGQGFFVVGNNAGGTVNFNNSQRGFFKEDHVSSNVMFRAAATTQNTNPAINEEDESDEDEDQFAKIRLGFNSNNFHRQVLLGFMNEHATSGIDIGYDAVHIDNQPNDMSFINNGVLLNIQGDTYFNVQSIFPLQVKMATQGEVSFTLDDTENFEEGQLIYIFDRVTGIFYDLRQGPAAFTLPAGTVSDRFSLRFITAFLSTHDDLMANKIQVAFEQKIETLNIVNDEPEVTVLQATLYNIVGQKLAEFDVKNEDQYHIAIPLNSYAAGTYIVKVSTTDGEFSEKIIIR